MLLQALRLAACLVCPLILIPSLAAHRLDECLQAVRFDLHTDRIVIELDITPGVEALPQWMKVADVNNDGTMDQVEGLAYSELVLQYISLELDGKKLIAKTESVSCPSPQSLKEGNGMVRITYTAPAPRRRWNRGTHVLKWSNQHLVNQSAYLANAMMPSDRRLQIVRQERDVTQRNYTLTFRR